MGFQKRPKREPIKHFFPVPNEIFILGLSPGEIAVYCYLLRTEDRQTFQCYPSYEAIGKAVGVSRNTVAWRRKGSSAPSRLWCAAKTADCSTEIGSTPSAPSRRRSRRSMSGS